MFASFGSDAIDLPVTDWLTERVISLPIHTEMEKEQLEYITSQVLAFINK
jgi:dTDP-4-amino-4,6-dideoxygalactose transaminase